MKHTKLAESRGTSIRTFNYLSAGLSVLLSVAFLFTVHQIVDEYSELRVAAHGYNELDISSRELMEASDYLTEQVRLFTITGERRYLNNYFDEATVNRRREKALEQLHDTGAVPEAYENLERAMQESVALMQTEYLAMRITVEAYGLELSDFPQEVREVALPAKYAGASQQELRTAACMLLLNEDYCRQKEAISDNMNKCIITLFAAMNERQEAVEEKMNRLILQLRTMIIVTIGFVFLRILLSSRLVVSPLLRAAPLIRNGEPMPVDGVFELRFLAQAYNRMSGENRAYTERLAYEANHDRLTGVFNRSGYEELLESIDMSDAALLLIDVDKFKSVNDTYGHKAGDLALETVSKALAEHFRSGDSVCRIGGDEFAVVMQHTGPECKEQIEAKIARINERLRAGRGEAPPLSVSAGCAFGVSPNGSGSIVKDADAALYRVKEHGRCGCAFFE